MVAIERADVESCCTCSADKKKNVSRTALFRAYAENYKNQKSNSKTHDTTTSKKLLLSSRRQQEKTPPPGCARCRRRRCAFCLCNLFVCRKLQLRQRVLPVLRQFDSNTRSTTISKTHRESMRVALCGVVRQSPGIDTAGNGKDCEKSSDDETCERATSKS